MKKVIEDNTLKLDEIVNDTIEEQLENNPNDLISLIAMSELTNFNKLKTISRVKMEQVPILSKLYLYAETFNTPFVKNLADNILQLQISLFGLGRKELVSVVNTSNVMQEQKTLLGKKEVFR